MTTVILKPLIITAAAAALLAVPALAQVDPKSHRMCIDAKDYTGCIKEQQKEVKAKKIKQSPAEALFLGKCAEFHSFFRNLRDYAPSTDACIRAYEIQSLRNYNEPRDAMFIALLARYYSAVQGLESKRLEEILSCSVDFANVHSIKTEDVGIAFKYCTGQVDWRVQGGLTPVTKEGSINFSFRQDSVKKATIRGDSTRYLTFLGRSVNSYFGTSNYTIKGTPAVANCGWGGSGSKYGWSSGGSCSYNGGTPDRVIPGMPAGNEYKLFKYVLDCKDKTFDRKGDRITADGFMKGWLDISDDIVATAVADAYCPIIKHLPQ